MKRLQFSIIIFIIITFSCISGLDEKQPAENEGRGNGKKPETVYLIKISDQKQFMVDTVLSTYIRNSLKQAKDSDIVLLEIDTYGGQLTAMEEIRDHIDSFLETYKGRLVAYIPKRAISAGAAITVVCPEIIMKERAQFGDCAPVVSTAEGPKLINQNDKITSVLRQDFETACRKNGYPYRLGHAMVSQRFATYILTESSACRIYSFDEFKNLPQKERKKISGGDVPTRTEFYFPDQVKAGLSDSSSKNKGKGSEKQTANIDIRILTKPVVVVIDEVFEVDGRKFCFFSKSPKAQKDFISLSETEEKFLKKLDYKLIDASDELLHLSAEQAYAYHFAKKVVKNKLEMFDYYGINASDVTEITPSTAETAVRWLNSPVVASLLIMIGIIAIYAELHTPGFGIAGAAALVCFALYFLFGFLAREPHLLPVILFLLGIVLLLLEIFVIPGFGVAGISGMVLLLLGLLTVRLPEELYKKGGDVQWTFDMFFEPITVVFGGFLLGLIGCVIIARFLPEIQLFSSHVVQGPERIESASESGISASNIKTDIHVGDEAVVTTDLRPSGKIEIAGRQVTAVSSGDYISRGSRVRIVKVRGNQIIAEEV